jgi:membrane protease YdiL (CAAX protease family)
VIVDIKFWLGYVSEWLGAVAVVMIAGASPLLKKVRRIEFRFARRDATYALSLFAVIYMAAFQFFSNAIFDFLKIFSAKFVGGELAQRMVLAVICLVPFLLAMILRGQPLKSIGWGKENLKPGAILGFLLLVLTIFLRGKFSTLIKGIPQEQANLLIVWLVVALAEETIFRGYIHLRLTSYWGETWGWLATAVLFVLWQLPGRLGILPMAQLWPILLIALVQGLLLGWIMRKSGSVLAPTLFRIAAGWLLLL